MVFCLACCLPCDDDGNRGDDRARQELLAVREHVDHSLKGVPGVMDLEVDAGSGRVTVHLADGHQPLQARFARAIRQNGVTLARPDTL